MTPVWDILERWRAEEALRESEHRYRQLVELSQDGILQMDMRGYIVTANRAACEMFGIQTEECWDYYFPIPTYLTNKIVAFERLKQIKSNKSMRFERVALRHDGTTFPVEVSVSPLTQGYFQEVIRDVTERKKAEESVKESERRLR